MTEYNKCVLDKSREGTLYTACGAIALYRKGEMCDRCKYCGRKIVYGDSLTYADVKAIRKKIYG